MTTVCCDVSLLWRKFVPKLQSEITTTRCVTTQKSVLLNFFAAEAWNYARSGNFHEGASIYVGIAQCMVFGRWRSHQSLLGVLKWRGVGVYLHVEASWNVMAHAPKPDFVSRRKGRVHLNWRGHQFSRLLAAEVCASAVVMLDTSCSDVVWRVLATHSIRQFTLHFPSRASQCAITFQLDSTQRVVMLKALAVWILCFFKECCTVDAKIKNENC